MLEVKPVNPAQADVLKLIGQLDQYQIGLYGIEKCHLDSPAELSSANVLMLGAFFNSGLVGIGAVKLFSGYAEIKRVIVDPQFRGKKFADELMTKLEQHALDRGVRRICLETGYLQKEAIGFYSKLGYKTIGPFGDYGENGVSVFMEKVL